MKLLLNGARMRERTFNKRFRKIVGVHFHNWIRRKSVKSWGNSEFYDYQDDTFLVGGSAYDPPRLWKKTKSDIKKSL